MKYLLALLVACSPAAPPPPDCDSCIHEHAACAQSCAVCCETQPYYSGKQTAPIHACGSEPIADWSVAWCRTDCENLCRDCSEVCR